MAARFYMHVRYTIQLTNMSLLTIVIVLIIAGVILYLINRYIPMDGKIKTILNIVVVIILIIWLLKAFGIWGGVSDVRV
jgi:hypothetical protein